MTIIIKPMKRILGGGRLAHVFDEMTKGTPTLTDADATPAIIGILRMRRAFAASFHVRPKPVYTGFRLAVGTVGVANQAAAGAHLPFHKVLPKGFSFATAFAKAQPPSGCCLELMIAGEFSNYRQTPKYLPGHVDCSHTELYHQTSNHLGLV